MPEQVLADCPCGWSTDHDDLQASARALRGHAATCPVEVDGKPYWQEWRKATCPLDVGERVQHPDKGWMTVQRIDGLHDCLALVGRDLKMKPYWDVVVRRDGWKRNECINLQPFTEPEKKTEA